jgi:hypothetical protein
LKSLSRKEKKPMGEKKLATVTETDRRVFIYDLSIPGFALRYVSGPANGPKKGEWLDRWELIDGNRRFGFSSNRVLFRTQADAEQIQEELRKNVDFITEVVAA